MKQIRERMEKLKLTQAALVLMLRERGVAVTPPELSQVLREIIVYPKAQRIRVEIEHILDDMECSRERTAET